MARAEEIFRSVATDEKHFYVIGEMDGRIVAHANVTIVPTISEGLGTYAVLNHVCVRPDVRRGGIGMKLLNACFAVAKHYDCKSMKLWSKNFRTAAHGLYKKYGFEVIDAKFFEKEVE